MDETVSVASLKAVLRFSLLSTPSSSLSDFYDEAFSVAAGGPPIDENDPRIRKLIDQILFSRRFILTYYVAVVGVLLLFIFGHWSWRLKSRWKRSPVQAARSYPKETEREYQGTASSSRDSSTGAESPSRNITGHAQYGERTPLLVPQSHNATAAIRGGMVANVRGWTMYQPAPIPAVTAPKNVLPANSTTVLILLLLALNIFYLLYHVPLTIPMLFVLADRAGLCFVVNIPILYLFAAKTQPLNFLIGKSYEGLNILHRRLGEWMCLLALLHALGMLGVWYTLLQRIGFTLGRYLSERIIILGICAAVMYECIYITSIGYFRQQLYELFLGLHILLQIAGLVLVWFHHHNSRPFVGMTLAIYLIDRLIFRMTLTTVSTQAKLTVAPDEETVVLSSTITFRTPKFPYMRTSLLSGWLPSHHVFLTVPALSRQHVLQAHPFTIASPAPPGDTTAAELKLIIRAQDGFSRDILRFAKGHGKVTVRLDGPYGSQAAVELLRCSDVAVVVAGGSGIAVAWPLIWSLLGPEANLEDPGRKKILLLWVTRDRKHAEWIGKDQIKQVKEMGVEVVMPPPTDEYGRPDVVELLQEWIPKKDCDYNGEPGRKRFGVVVSGPDAMNRNVRNACAMLAAQGRDVHIEVEKFGW